MHHVAWVLLADMKQAKLLCCGLTKNNRCHVEVHDTMKNDLPEHDHPKSSPMWKNASVSFGIVDYDTQEDDKRFMQVVTDWLGQKMKALDIAHIVVLGPPHLTGALRKTKFAQRHAVNVIQHKGDLINLPTGKLAEHAIIRGLVEDHPTAE